MRNFQDTFETRKRSFISVFSICMTVPLRKVTQIIKNLLMRKKSKNDTRLSTEYWKLVNKKLRPRISWSINGKYKSYNPNSRRCSLRLHEKLKIIDDPDEILLSKRSEVISQCRHRNKYKLKTLVSNKKYCDIA